MVGRNTRVEHDFGEATLTSKGQITVPNALRQALSLTAGDRFHFVGLPDGSVRMEARKRRRIVDIARANPIRLADAGGDVDAAIEQSITEAMLERVRRTRPRKGP
jgi:bifunctional DNA-binding transcriptional regulator/antitoxin component of YhaV-PrlF toxin-antitoxin module